MGPAPEKPTKYLGGDWGRDRAGRLLACARSPGTRYETFQRRGEEDEAQLQRGEEKSRGSTEQTGEGEETKAKCRQERKGKR